MCTIRFIDGIIAIVVLAYDVFIPGVGQGISFHFSFLSFQCGGGIW